VVAGCAAGLLPSSRRSVVSILRGRHVSVIASQPCTPMLLWLLTAVVPDTVGPAVRTRRTTDGRREGPALPGNRTTHLPQAWINARRSGCAARGVHGANGPRQQRRAARPGRLWTTAPDEGSQYWAAVVVGAGRIPLRELRLARRSARRRNAHAGGTRRDGGIRCWQGSGDAGGGTTRSRPTTVDRSRTPGSLTTSARAAVRPTFSSTRTRRRSWARGPA
jgi:hypothetical protein